MLNKISINLVFAEFHVLIDKRKPITGMGCLEFVMCSGKNIYPILLTHPLEDKVKSIIQKKSLAKMLRTSVKR